MRRSLRAGADRFEMEGDMGNILEFIGGGGPNLLDARRLLQKNLTDISSTQGQIDRLHGGLAKIASNLQTFETGKAAVVKEVSISAAHLAALVRGGVDWTISQIAGARVHSAASRLESSGVEAAVLETAAQNVKAEIASLEERLAELRSATRGLALEAVRASAAAGMLDDWHTIKDRVREHMIRLAAFERLAGIGRIGRMVAEIPSFTREDGLDREVIAAEEGEVVKALAVWKQFTDAIQSDPSTPVSMLDFPPINPEIDPNVVYDQLTPTERRQKDLRFQFQGVAQ
jgi:hypothetical protein